MIKNAPEKKKYSTVGTIMVLFVGLGLLFFAYKLIYPKNNTELSKTKSMAETDVKIEKRSRELIGKSIGVWAGTKKNGFNYCLVDSSGFHLFKIIYPDYELTDTAIVSKKGDETIIRMKNALNKEHYKINVLGDLVYYDDEGKPFHTYSAIEK